MKSCDDFTFKYCNDFSWTFQFKDKFGNSGKDSLFMNGDNDDLIALVHMEDHFSNKGTIKALLPWSILKNYLRNPINPKYKDIKQCLYYEDIRKESNLFLI